MTIHTRKLPTFALYAAFTEEFGVTVFGNCRDEALNNLADELAVRGTRGGAEMENASKLATKGERV